MSGALTSLRAGTLAVLTVLGCASIEPGRYGVSAIDVEGDEAMHEKALEACLVTMERPHFELKLGVGSPNCNEPPFESTAPAVKLWRWPWTDWPSFNQAVFNQDLERILRWYRARGFYDAKVLEVRYEPPEAGVVGGRGRCDPEQEQCTVEIVIVIDEGKPVVVSEVRLSGFASRNSALMNALWQSVEELRGQRFDEAIYDERKRALGELLREHGFAGADIDGRVRIDTAKRQASIDFLVESGPLYQFGSLSVSGHGSLSEAPIRAAAALPTGQRFDPRVLGEVETEVFALGAFSAVEVEEKLDEQKHHVDVEVRVTPLAPDQLRVGVGVLSGATQRTETGELASIPQWDIHLFGNYERRHVLGTLGRLRIEERPRMIFGEPFPTFTQPAWGNVLGVRLNQPGMVEPRTDLFENSVWDFGPDPFLGFRRHDIFVRVGMRRGFFSRRLLGTLALQQDFFIVPRGDNATSDGSPTPTPYAYAFLEQDLRLDLRDHRLRPTFGAYLGFNATQAPRFALSDWTQVRLAPETRGYLPLPLDMVLAARFALGSIFILDASPELDELSQELGPSSYRLRGGGANSNRGFLPGELGAGVQGGLRRWESSLELRLAFGEALGLVGFLDLGDVNDTTVFRFDHLNASAGSGLRYYTVIGVLRLDVGLRIPAWQRADGSEAIEEDANNLPWSRTPGAVHFTIGESF